MSPSSASGGPDTTEVEQHSIFRPFSDQSWTWPPSPLNTTWEPSAKKVSLLITMRNLKKKSSCSTQSLLEVLKCLNLKRLHSKHELQPLSPNPKKLSLAMNVFRYSGPQTPRTVIVKGKTLIDNHVWKIKQQGTFNEACHVADVQSSSHTVIL